MTVAEIIAQARHEDPSFTDRRHTGHVLRKFVADCQRRILTRAAEIAPEAVSEPYDVPLPMESFHDGHLLVEEDVDPEDPEGPPILVPLRYLSILEHGEAHKDTGERPRELSLVHHASRWTSGRGGPAWIHAGRLYLQGEPGHWEGFNLIRIFFIATPPITLGSAESPIFASEAFDAYRNHVAWRMAARFPKEISRPLSEFKAAYDESFQDFLDQLEMRHSVDWRVRDVDYANRIGEVW